MQDRQALDHGGQLHGAFARWCLVNVTSRLWRWRRDTNGGAQVRVLGLKMGDAVAQVVDLITELGVLGHGVGQRTFLDTLQIDKREV